MTDDKKEGGDKKSGEERKGIKLYEDHERGGNGGFKVTNADADIVKKLKLKLTKCVLRQRQRIQWILWVQSKKMEKS